jgi:hypothetical protein
VAQFDLFNFNVCIAKMDLSLSRWPIIEKKWQRAAK